MASTQWLTTAGHLTLFKRPCRVNMPAQGRTFLNRLTMLNTYSIPRRFLTPTSHVGA
jgi:hypothetical protein